MADNTTQWSRSEYEHQIYLVRSAAQKYADWIQTGLGNVNVNKLEAWADGKFTNLKLSSAIKMYKDETVRLQNLHKALKQYLVDYEDMIKRAENKMDSVESVTSSYSGFGNIFAGISAASGVAMAGSAAYQFAQSGKTFSGDFDDMTAFMNSDVYKLANTWLGVSKINDFQLYAQTIFSEVTGADNRYVVELVRSGLKSMVESIPGSEPVGIDNVDWYAIGKKLGIEDLEQYMEPISKLLEQMSDGVFSNETASELSKYISLLKDVLFKSEKAKALADLCEDLGKYLTKMKYAGTAVDVVSNLLANYFNTYADQISYLDTMKESMIAAGYWSESPVIQQIDILNEMYNDTIKKSIYELSLNLGDEVDGILKEGVTKGIPVLGNVDKFFSIVSKTSAIYGTDRVKAASSLMGCVQFDNVLTQTYEHYSALVESGVATEAEIEQADKLFDMMCALKKKEYESMKTIAENYDDRWYNIATDKLEELEELRKGSIYDSASEDVKEIMNEVERIQQQMESIAFGRGSGSTDAGDSESDTCDLRDATYKGCGVYEVNCD